MILSASIMTWDRRGVTQSISFYDEREYLHLMKSIKRGLRFERHYFTIQRSISRGPRGQIELVSNQLIHSCHPKASSRYYREDFSLSMCKLLVDSFPKLFSLSAGHF